MVLPWFSTLNVSVSRLSPLDNIEVGGGQNIPSDLQVQHVQNQPLRRSALQLTSVPFGPEAVHRKTCRGPAPMGSVWDRDTDQSGILVGGAGG